MKSILSIALLILNISVFGQSLFFNEFKVIDFQVPRSCDSYESRIIRIDNNDTLIRTVNNPIGLYWNPLNTNEIVGCNIYTCGKWNLTTYEFDTLFTCKPSVIIEFTCNDNFCYILTTPYEHERFDSYNLYKIDLNDNKIEEIKLMNNYGILNLYASNKYLSFIDYKYEDETGLVFAKLIIYDLVSKQFTTIDEALSSKNEWFGGVDDRSVMCWKNDNELYYFKKESQKTKGTIFKYNLKSKTKIQAFEIPYDRINSFALKDNGVILLNDDEIVFMDEQGEIIPIYKVGYKFDYIVNQFYYK